MTTLPEGTDLADIPVASAGDIFVPAEADAVEPPQPYRSPFGIMQHTWTGTDGSVWDLSRPESGVFIVQEALEGMGNPLTDEVSRESPSLAGARFNGYRVKPRDVIWSIYIYTDDSSEAFYDLDGRFWDSVKIGQYGTWRVTLPDGSFRELSMRIVPQSNSHERDPGRFGWVKYAIRFVADRNPFWTYPLELPGSRATFTSEQGENFFGGAAGVAPSFYISPSRVEINRTIYNDGDEDVWGIYHIEGPMDFIDMRVGNRSYHVECDLMVGQWIEINTRPDTFGITDNTGADRMDVIDNWTFDPYPTKASVDVEIFPQGLGGGWVAVDVSPLYHRAWGASRGI